MSVQATPYIAGGRIINFDEPCDYFTVGKTKASTLSLSVLVAIEMFNALNALSEVHTSLPFSCRLDSEHQGQACRSSVYGRR